MKRDVVVTSLVRQKAAQKPAVNRGVDALRRVEHLESQMAKLSELVREHAEDVDRLVRIVAEDRDVIRRQLLRGFLPSGQYRPVFCEPTPYASSRELPPL